VRQHLRKHYVAVVHKDADCDFGVSFPDFPGAVTAAPTLEEAIKRAGEALALHVEGMVADGKTIPEPTGLSPILADPAYRTDVLALVPLQLPEGNAETMC
jgi:predicted RNase H-like HicB family nuclease